MTGENNTTKKEEDITFQKRQVAYHYPISCILNSRYIEEEGWNPNYLMIGKEKVSRINLIAIIISKQERSLLLEDGTGNIQARSLDQQEEFGSFDIGDVIQIIGRPREFNQERYILIEIIKNIDKAWLSHRKKFIEKNIPKDILDQRYSTDKINAEEKDTIEINKEENEEDKQDKETAKDMISEDKDKNISEKDKEPEKEITPAEQIIELIKDLDSGDGADFDEVAEKIKDGESVIKSLMIEGEIFEISPGKLKVLD